MTKRLATAHGKLFDAATEASNAAATSNHPSAPAYAGLAAMIGAISRAHAADAFDDNDNEDATLESTPVVGTEESGMGMAFDPARAARESGGRRYGKRGTLRLRCFVR